MTKKAITPEEAMTEVRRGLADAHRLAKNKKSIKGLLAVADTWMNIAAFLREHGDLPQQQPPGGQAFGFGMELSGDDES